MVRRYSPSLFFSLFTLACNGCEHLRKVMHTVFVCFILYVPAVVACDSDKPAKPLVFAMEDDFDSGNGLRTFVIYSSIKKEDMYFWALQATVENEFSLSLDIREDREYLGDWYMSSIEIADKHVAALQFVVDYNSADKQRSGFAFCANWARYTLQELLQAARPERDPSFDKPPPPPPMPDEE